MSAQEEHPDSLICFTPSEVRTLTKMSEDLRYTKAELEAADSVIYHQGQIITLKDQMIDLRTQELQKNIRDSHRRQIKVGLISGGIGLILGTILGIFL